MSAKDRPSHPYRAADSSIASVIDAEPTSVDADTALAAVAGVRFHIDCGGFAAYDREQLAKFIRQCTATQNRFATVGAGGEYNNTWIAGVCVAILAAVLSMTLPTLTKVVIVAVALPIIISRYRRGAQCKQLALVATAYGELADAFRQLLPTAPTASTPTVERTGVRAEPASGRSGNLRQSNPRNTVPPKKGSA